MRISDWSSDVCSSDLIGTKMKDTPMVVKIRSSTSRVLVMSRLMVVSASIDSAMPMKPIVHRMRGSRCVDRRAISGIISRSEEHTSELQSLMRISYAVFCLKKKNKHKMNNIQLR